MILLYGANGYTGQLILKKALEKGLKPVIAGRSEYSISKLAGEHGLQYRVFEVDDPKIDEHKPSQHTNQKL